MEDWVMAINSHIHVKFKTEHEITSENDFWEDGEVGTSFWKVPDSPLVPNVPRKAVGIRTVPYVNGKFSIPINPLFHVQVD